MTLFEIHYPDGQKIRLLLNFATYEDKAKRMRDVRRIANEQANRHDPEKIVRLMTGETLWAR